MSSRWQISIEGTSRKTEVLQGASIFWGRSDINQQPSPATATFTLRRVVDDPIEPDFVVGNLIEAYIAISPSSFTKQLRFWGQITDIQMDRYTYTLTCVSPLTRLMQEQFGYKYGPIEGPVYQMYVVQNGQNILSWLGGATYQLPLDLDDGENYSSWWYDEGTYNLWDFVGAFVAGETSGVLGEEFGKVEYGPVGSWYTVRFTDATARRKTTPDLTLTDTEILQNWQIEQQVSDKVNTVNISRSANDYLGWLESNTIVANNDDVYTYGAYSLSLAATYSDDASIRKVGTSIVGLQTVPTYRLHKVTVPMSTLTDSRQDEILDAIRQSALIEIPELVPGFPTVYFLEGTYEVVAQPDGWTIDLILSEASLTHPPDRWIDVDPSTDWASLPYTLTWNDAYKERFS